MSARITALRLEAFEQLPKHARRCVFWEVDPAILGKDDHLADPEFEKEAWLSMVMLEWGSCGQVATAVPDERSHAEPHPASGMCSTLRPVRCREPSGFLPRRCRRTRCCLRRWASSAGKQMTTYRTV